jgi:hypothetical protein
MVLVLIFFIDSGHSYYLAYAVRDAGDTGPCAHYLYP